MDGLDGLEVDGAISVAVDSGFAVCFFKIAAFLLRSLVSAVGELPLPDLDLIVILATLHLSMRLDPVSELVLLSWNRCGAHQFPNGQLVSWLEILSLNLRVKKCLFL